MELEKILEKEPLEIIKRRTKGLFYVENLTSSGNWIQDRDWKLKANQDYNTLQNKRDEIEFSLLIKKKN